MTANGKYRRRILYGRHYRQNARAVGVLVIVGNDKTFGPVAPMAIGDAHNPCPRALVTVIGERDAGRDGGEVVWLLAN